MHSRPIGKAVYSIEHTASVYLSLKKDLKNYFTCLSSDTVSLYLPLALLLASTLRPFFVLILDLKPCLLALLLLEG
jgi:hypothetical protein